MVIVNVNEDISKLFFLPDISLRRLSGNLALDKFPKNKQ